MVTTPSVRMHRAPLTCHVEFTLKLGDNGTRIFIKNLSVYPPFQFKNLLEMSIFKTDYNTVRCMAVRSDTVCKPVTFKIRLLTTTHWYVYTSMTGFDCQDISSVADVSIVTFVRNMLQSQNLSSVQ